MMAEDWGSDTFARFRYQAEVTLPPGEQLRGGPGGDGAEGPGGLGDDPHMGTERSNDRRR